MNIEAERLQRKLWSVLSEHMEFKHLGEKAVDTIKAVDAVIAEYSLLIETKQARVNELEESLRVLGRGCGLIKTLEGNALLLPGDFELRVVTMLEDADVKL